MVQIIPSILSTTEEDYKQKIENISQSPDLEGGWVQIDLMDNKFVQNKSVEVSAIAKHPTPLHKEVHLMVENSSEWVDSLKEAGVERVIIHIEAEGFEKALDKIKSVGLSVGIALNPETPVAKVGSFIGMIDVVLLMSVRPGFGGQEFLPETLGKIRETVKLRGGNKFLIEVDGGVSDSNAKDIVEAGADILIIGEHLINGNITENIEQIWESLNS